MTSISDRVQDGTEMGPVVVNDRTAITLPIVLSIGAVILAALMWANSVNVAIAQSSTERRYDREKMDEMQQTLREIRAILEARQR